MSSSKSGLKRICQASSMRKKGGGGAPPAYLVARDGIQEGGDALVEKVEQHREIDDERAAEGLDVVLLQDVEHLARDGY